MNDKHPEIYHPHNPNPILTAENWLYTINSVFNACATVLPEETTLLLCRVEDRRGLSHLCAACSVKGNSVWQMDPEPKYKREYV